MDRSGVEPDPLGHTAYICETYVRPILVRCDLGVRVRWRTQCGRGVKLRPTRGRSSQGVVEGLDRASQLKTDLDVENFP